MSLVTTARLMRGQNWRVSWSTSAVLPEPTGPATPTRNALGNSLGSIALASSTTAIARCDSQLQNISVKYATDAGSVKRSFCECKKSAGRIAGLAHVFVLQRQRADHIGNLGFITDHLAREVRRPSIGNRTGQVHGFQAHQRQQVSRLQQAPRALAAGEPEMFLQQQAQPALFLGAVADFRTAHEFVVAIIAGERVAKNVG